MHFVSLATTLSLIERSERTLWRLVAEGTIKREIFAGKAMFHIDSLKPFFSVQLSEEEQALIEKADGGDATAQTDLALSFLKQGKSSTAIYWLELATQQEYPDAMSLLGYCYIEGRGISKDEKQGLIWVTRAAALGHPISETQISRMPNALGLLAPP